MNYTKEQLRDIDLQIAQQNHYQISSGADGMWYFYHHGQVFAHLKKTKGDHDEMKAWRAIWNTQHRLMFTTITDSAMMLLKERPSFNLHYDHRQRLWCIWEQKYAPKRKDFYGYAATPALAICQACYPYLFEAVQS